MKTLTVFTPTYNRKHTLIRTYKSLCRQTNSDFEWLIIDDGSTDNTETVVKGWIKENIIPIRYIKKDNEGLHTGYTTAIANMFTELNVCIDSDDFMPDNAVELIVNTWSQCKDKKLAGIVGLDFLMDNTPNGGWFQKTGLFHIYEMVKFHHGDTKIVCRTDLLKELNPMPVFEGEKNFNPMYYYLQIDKDYKFLILNENFCIVDYQNDGMSANIYSQFKNSPHSFAEYRRLCLALPYYNWRKKFRINIHYVSSCIFGKEWNFLKTTPTPIMTCLAILPGILLNLYLRYKTK